MASAVLASRNESSRALIGKIPCSNSHMNAIPNPNPKKQKLFHHSTGSGVFARHPSNDGDSTAVTQSFSDDAYSFNQPSTSCNAFDRGSYMNYEVSAYTRSEVVDLRKRLSAELVKILDLRNRIESGQFGISRNPPKSLGNKSKKLSSSHPTVIPFGTGQGSRLHEEFRNPVDGLKNTSDFEGLMKECKQILTKLLKNKCVWIFKAPVDAVALGLHDYHQIVRRPMDLGTVKANLSKNVYLTPLDFAADVRLTFNNALLYNPKTDPVNEMAHKLLTKFEELFAHIQATIDELTVYEQREREFRECRPGHEYNVRRNEKSRGDSWGSRKHNPASSPLKSSKGAMPKESPLHLSRGSTKHERTHIPLQAHSSASTASNPPPSLSSHLPLQEKAPSPTAAPGLPAKEPKVGRGVGIPKQPKPRAKDQNKRDMSMEEKQKLGLGLQGMPQEKMPQLVHIIRKRNEHLAQDGDEIELDIEALDTETLWELDRFVTNWKKFMSKVKRQALMTNLNTAAGIAHSSPLADLHTGMMDDGNDGSPKILKDDEDEDVDIDDDIPETSFPPVEIEKDDGAGGGVGDGPVQYQDRANASSSSSSSSGSSSDSSSSSDSESGSSSGSDSDADDARS